MTREELLEIMHKSNGRAPIIRNESFHNSNLKGLDLRYVRFENCIFAEIDFYGTQSGSRTFMNCVFLYCDFTQSKMLQAAFNEYDNCEFGIQYSSRITDICFLKNATTKKELPRVDHNIPDEDYIFKLEM